MNRSAFIQPCKSDGFPASNAFRKEYVININSKEKLLN